MKKDQYKFCIDCVHSKQRFIVAYGDTLFCMNRKRIIEKSLDPSLITGDLPIISYNRYSCLVERANTGSGFEETCYCGPDGIFYKERPYFMVLIRKFIRSLKIL